ncbi:GGDEF domain-containing protein [Cyanobium sp. FGCU-6]|nr:GGDEF domain-containing protein [Cyanobium sp. FGCU6]
MKQRRLPTFWQSNLIQETQVLVLLILLFAASGGWALTELRKRYIALYRAEAKKIELALSEQLQQARVQLAHFAELSESQRNLQTARLLADFSDLYEIDPQLRITRIIKSLPRSQVFPGFTLSRSALASDLLQTPSATDISPVLRGFEDSRASIYIVHKRPGGLLLGRMNLESLQRFLRQSSATTQTPVLLIPRDGSVLLASNTSLRIPAFPIHETPPNQAVREPLSLAGQNWIPILTSAHSVGATIVTLVPTKELADEQSAIVMLLVIASVGSGTLVALKTLRMRRQFSQPIAELADSMRNLRSSATDGEPEIAMASFSELETIQLAFQAMAREIREREQQLRLRATVDELTGLLTRRELLEQLQELLNHPERHRPGEGLAVLFSDLDRFKEINDGLGHAAGDLVLRSVAERIRQVIHSDDLAGRMGGDEMVVVLRSVADLDAAVAVAETIAAAISRPIRGDAMEAMITASIGVAFAMPAEGVDALIARADIAMYEAKQAGRARVIRID